jgi:ribosomal protein S18 acetylase RimI-like enzyme
LRSTEISVIVPDKVALMGSIASFNSREITLSHGLELRPAQAADGAFMEELFRSAREYFYAMPISRQHIDLLVVQQYQLQQASYARQWPAARTMIIERSGQAIGKIMLDESATVVHIIDFVLEPGMRGKGYGTAILQTVQAAAGKRRMKLSVDRQNLRAKKFYLGFGFQVNAISDTHESMIWTPAVNRISQM